MSVKLISRVWDESKQTGTALICLLALADWANDEGLCYPSIDRLAKKTRTGARNVQLVINKLVKDGELKVEVGASRHGTNHYWVFPEKEVAKEVESETDGGEAQFTGGVK